MFYDYEITSNYGMRVHPISGENKMHNGIDYAIPEGTQLQSNVAGKVKSTGYSNSAGNYIVIEDNNGAEHKYFHLQKSNVSTGDIISSGQVIGLTGNTGNSTGPHLHYEVRVNGSSVNPSTYTGTGAAVKTEVVQTGNNWYDGILDIIGEIILFIALAAIGIFAALFFMKAFDIKIRS